MEYFNKIITDNRRTVHIFQKIEEICENLLECLKYTKRHFSYDFNEFLVNFKVRENMVLVEANGKRFFKVVDFLNFNTTIAGILASLSCLYWFQIMTILISVNPH